MNDLIKQKLEEFYENQLGYVLSNGKKLRRGITTGTVATAVSKAGVIYLITQKSPSFVELFANFNKKIKVLIERYEYCDDHVLVYARKYAGDDIDATNFALIYAKVSKRDDDKISIRGGKGVGIVTKEGLDIDIGQGAINSTPKKNITKEIQSITKIGFDIEICVENGEEIAKKTFNSRLGIRDGISIIGTTGIVEPMSVEAMKSSISREIKVKSKNTDNIILAFGNMGEKLLNTMGISSSKICICSNYIGHALEEIINYENIKYVLIAGNFGKAVKLAGGIFNTHSHIADAKNEIVAANLALMKAPFELIELVMNANTTRQVTEYIKNYNFQEIYDILAKKSCEKCDLASRNSFKTYVMLIDYDNNILNNINIDRFLD